MTKRENKQQGGTNKRRNKMNKEITISEPTRESSPFGIYDVVTVTIDDTTYQITNALTRLDEEQNIHPADEDDLFWSMGKVLADKIGLTDRDEYGSYVFRGTLEAIKAAILK